MEKCQNSNHTQLIRNSLQKAKEEVELKKEQL